ncbi:alpha/beta fold hydrolase [Mucilaginibacter sp.]|uniref:alpha/beta fold hydrolase n=1 Tax=Mucilaginibacter sp. TaxID=1882438 RepID=UPI003D11226D
MKILKLSFITLLFLLAAAAIVLTVVYKGKDKEKKDLTDKERKATTGQYIKLSQGITHYQLTGPDTGKVVILIHGFSVPYFIWDGTYEYLVKKGFKVLRYDMYGRGYSDRPDVVYNQDLYNNQLLELIKQLHLKTPVSIAGVSFGGGVVVNFTCKHPDLVSKAIMIDPIYLNMKPAAPTFYLHYYEATHGDERANGQLSDFKYPKRHPDWVNQYLVQMQYEGFRNALISTMFNYNYIAKESLSCLNSVHKPVLLIWGKEDHTVPFTYSDSVRSVLKVDFFPVDDAAHLPFIEQPDKVNAKIADFLKI